MSNLAESLEEYTYEDYESFPEDFRCELIDGVVYMMSAPDMWHQEMLGMIHLKIGNYLSGKKCRVFLAPFDVRLFPRKDKKDRTVVQPDIIIVCDEDKLSDGKACRGAPDVVIEILSESTRSHDLNTKKEKYERAGVKQYVVVGKGMVLNYVLDEGKYSVTRLVRGKQGAKVSLLPIDFAIDI
jgi:Uma2 family endonuclease